MYACSHTNRTIRIWLWGNAPHSDRCTHYTPLALGHKDPTSTLDPGPKYYILQRPDTLMLVCVECRCWFMEALDSLDRFRDLIPIQGDKFCTMMLYVQEVLPHFIS